MKRKMVLKCDLTEHEVNDIAKEMSERLNQKSLLENEKKESNKKYSREISYYEKKIVDAGILINQGYEEREVDVEIKMNHPKKGLKTITRKDNNESWEEPMVLDDHDLFTSMGMEIDVEESKIRNSND